MSEQTRYRVTGAIFLVALAAILAPMLFDGDGLPKVDVKRLDAASPRQPVQAPTGAFQQPAFDELEQKATALRDGLDAQGFSETDGSSFGEVALIEPEPEEAVPAPSGLPSATKSVQNDALSDTQLASSNPSAAATPDSELARVWAVQVASFARGDNAQALRDELRGQGYEGFLSSAKRDGEVWTRVLVGPFLDKSEAQRVSGAIAAKFPVSPELRMVAQ